MILENKCNSLRLTETHDPSYTTHLTYPSTTLQYIVTVTHIILICKRTVSQELHVSIHVHALASY